MKRREFLARAAAGGAVITMPAFIAGCGLQPAKILSEPIPDNPFLDWFGVDQSTIRQVMSELTGKGADFADLYFQHAQSSSMRYEDGSIQNAETKIEQGVGLRVVSSDQTGYAITEDLSLESMLIAARTASTMASGIAITVPRAFQSTLPGDLYTVAVPWSGVGVDQKTSLFEFIEQKAKALEPTVQKVSVQLQDGDEHILIATHDGRLVTDRRPMSKLVLIVTMKNGEQVQSGFANLAARDGLDWYTEERLTAMVQEAVDHATVLFDARRPPVGEMPVILAAGTSGVLLHEAKGHSMEADFNRDGTSIYSDMIGNKIAEPFVNIVDQATLAKKRGSLNVDDEGSTTGRTVLVENGVLKSYLHDQVSARHYGVESTGSGRRPSFRFAPMPRMSCTFVENGPHSKTEIIEAVGRGVICETYLGGRAELGAGDFRFNVRNGWLVEKGKVTAPLKNFTISGNGPDLLKGISMVADDSAFDAGGWICVKKGHSVPVSQGMPTVLAAGITVGT